MRGPRAETAWIRVAALVFAAILGTSTGSWSATLEDAETAYLDGDFSGSLRILDDLIANRTMTTGELHEAWVLKGRCLTSLDRKSDAIVAFCEAIALKPEWRPDPVMIPADETKTFAEAQEACPPSEVETVAPTTTVGSGVDRRAGAKPWYKKPKIIGPILGVAAGGLLLVALSGDDDGGGGDRPLPDFPTPP
jgi:hypothetical protein